MHLGAFVKNQLPGRLVCMLHELRLHAGGSTKSDTLISLYRQLYAPLATRHTWKVGSLLTSGYGSKLKSWGYAGFSLWFHLPSCHFGTTFLSHGHLVAPRLGTFKASVQVAKLIIKRGHIDVLNLASILLDQL